MTAPQQIKRILALLPEIGTGNSHSIADLARKLGVEPGTILKDLRDFSNRLNDPPGWVEQIQIFVEADHISMGPTQHFRRPMRLNADEWRAVELGLAIVRAERAPDERPMVDAALEKVRQLISQEPEERSTRAATLGAERHTSALAALRKAMHERRRVEILYVKGGADAPDRRVICPFSFVVEQGMWYLVAICHPERSEGSGAIRIFRLDRVLELKVLSETFEPSAEVDVDELLSSGRAFVGNAPEKLRVRYSPRVARWIAEREQGTSNPDGSFEVEYPMADEGWALRHVLQYGPEAEVVSPSGVRDAVRQRLARLATA